MQALLYSLFMIAHAGHPQEDSEVTLRMNRFRVARPITDFSQLALGKTWHCLERAATRSDFRLFGPRAWFQFEVFDQTLVQSLPLPYRSLALQFDPASWGLSGTLTQHAHEVAHIPQNAFESQTRTLFFRAVSEQEWIIEVCSKKRFPGLRSLVDPKQTVVSYLSCQANDTSSEASTQVKETLSP